MQLFLERRGFVEETYHTFSYSPLFDDEGRIAGMLCVVNEDTERVIAARRMGTLRDIGTRSSDLTETETLATACEHLAGNPWSLPFTAIYLFDDDARHARLAGSTGFSGPHPAIPETIDVAADDNVWPVARLAHRESVEVDLADFVDLPAGAWPDPPQSALLVPLDPGGADPAVRLPGGGVSTGYRPVDEAYRGFLRLVAGQIAAAITDARAFEFERQRAESLARIDRAKTDFFTNVSHEFRTPLTLLLGPVEDALADTRRAAALRTAQPAGAGAAQRSSPAQAREQPARLLQVGVRPGDVAVRAGRPRALHRRAGLHVRLRRPPGRASA